MFIIITLYMCIIPYTYSCVFDDLILHAEIACPKITPPIYGKIYTSGYYPGDHAIYSCTYGYSLVGKHRIICLPSGKWSGGEHSCKKDHYYGYNDYHGYGNKYHGDDDDDDDDDY